MRKRSLSNRENKCSSAHRTGYTIPATKKKSDCRYLLEHVRFSILWRIHHHAYIFLHQDATTQETRSRARSKTTFSPNLDQPLDNVISKPHRACLINEAQWTRVRHIYRRTENRFNRSLQASETFSHARKSNIGAGIGEILYV